MCEEPNWKLEEKPFGRWKTLASGLTHAEACCEMGRVRGRLRPGDDIVALRITDGLNIVSLEANPHG